RKFCRSAGAAPDCTVAVAAADVVDRRLDLAWPAIVPVEQRRQIGAGAGYQRVGADPDQAEAGRAVGLAGQEATGGAVERVGELRWIGEAARARADAEVGGLQLERDAAGREPV